MYINYGIRNCFQTRCLQINIFGRMFFFYWPKIETKKIIK